MRNFIIAGSLLVLMVAAACNKPDDVVRAGDSGDEDAACPQADAGGVIEIGDGLVAKILKPGYGRAAESKDYADVHTTLWLYDGAADDGRGTEIWSSGGVQPFQFQLDSGQVIAGWDLGVRCMLIGEKRELRIPPELGYGARGKPPVPPNATLLFEIELVNLKAAE